MSWSVLFLHILFVLSGLLGWINGEDESSMTIPDVRIGHMQESGTGVLVRCVSSDENAQLQWYSVDITNGTAPVPVPIDEKQANCSFHLNLHSLSATNFIDYYCTANNSFGTARTVPFRAYCPPPPNISHVVTVPVLIGQRVVLSCNSTRFFPKATVEWYIKFETYFEMLIKPEESNKYDTIDDGHHLIINNITESDVIDSKIYACAAFYTRLNAPHVGFYRFPRYKLEIVDSLPGEFYTYLTPMNKVILSNETSLSYSFYYIAVSNNDTLSVVSYPSSHSNTAISVTYNGLPSEVINDLSVALALQDKSGVINGSTVTANITVIDPLVILPTTPSGVIHVSVGENITFNCTAAGTDVRVTFYLNGQEINKYNENLLIIRIATPADSSVYQCIWYSEAQNVYESATWALVVMEKTNDDNSSGNNSALVISLVVIGILVILAAVCVAIIMVIRRARAKQRMSQLDRNQLSIRKVSNDYVKNRVFSEANKKEVNIRPNLSSVIVLNHDLRLLDSIGRGEFGVVYKAQLFSNKTSSEWTLVAVKTLNGTFSDEEVNEFIEECLQMKSFEHPNVMNLMGVCLDAGPAPYLILPYMENGNLLSYLKNNRESLVLTENSALNAEVVSSVRIKLLSMCLQVAKGMEYLAIQKLVHRDLAARNCMIDETGIIKVADFGLAMSVYDQLYFRQDASDSIKLPIKWLAIESIEDGVFSEKTDVWAYGVTCWEIFSGGKVPYGGLSPLSIPKLLKNGERMEQPDNTACSEYVYQTLMGQCWQGNPDKRPTFSQLHNEISFTLTNMAGYMEFSTISLSMKGDTPV